MTEEEKAFDPAVKQEIGRPFILENCSNLAVDDGDEELLNGHVLFKYLELGLSVVQTEQYVLRIKPHLMSTKYLIRKLVSMTLDKFLLNLLQSATIRLELHQPRLCQFSDRQRQHPTRLCQLSTSNSEKLFQRMFPDSMIAKSFTCGEKKSTYVVCYGQATFSKQQLTDKNKLLDCFVLLFDESLNTFMQAKPLDIHVRYFDVAQNTISTRYLTRAFLCHATAALMAEAFMEKCHSLNMTRMIQLSMDGPKFSWSFYTKLMAEMYETDDLQSF